MENIIFGELLGRLLYLSNQKKSSLAKELGYDISYISKWINSKNLPSSKNANKICKDIADFIVDSLTDSTRDDIIKYFDIEVDTQEDIQIILSKDIEKYLKESYLSTTGNVSNNVTMQETYIQQRYNSINYVSPRLRKKFLSEEISLYLEKNEELDIILYVDIFNLPMEEKISLALTKDVMDSFENKENLKMKFLTGFNYNEKDFLTNAMIIINMVASYPKLNFEVYSCDIATSTAILLLKDKLSYIGILRNDGVSLLSNMSKEKDIVNEFYYNIEGTLKTHGRAICNKKSNKEIIKNNTYMEYIMGYDLRWLIGTINELFMPEDLFIEIAKEVFGDDEKIINEIKKINVFLQNVTYKSKMKIIIYESEIRKYISSGEMTFFNVPVKLNFKQREKHVKNFEKILKEGNEIDIRLIEGKITEGVKIIENPTMLLSKNLKLIKMSTQEDDCSYGVAVADEFKTMCNDLFNSIWDGKKDIEVESKEYVLDRISKAINYMQIMNEKIE